MTGSISPNLPSKGEPLGTADKRVRESLVTIRDGLNALLNSENKIPGSSLAKEGVGADRLVATAGSELKGFKAGLLAPSADLALTNAYQDVPGAEAKISVPVAGRLIVVASFSFLSGGVNEYWGTLRVDSTDESYGAFCIHGSSTSPSATQVFLPSVAAGERTLKLRSKCIGGAGTNKCLAANTRAGYLFIAT